MNCLAKSFELSSCAAARVGPKMRRSALRNASTMPAASGASGPTSVRPTLSRLANSISSGIAPSATFSSPVSAAVPPLPGATKTFCTRGFCASFHASACSRPPEPITKSFTVFPKSGIAMQHPCCFAMHRGSSMPEVAHAGEHHGDTALIGGGNHLVVAQAAAGLDHGGRTGIDDHVEAVAEREKGVGSRHRTRERQFRVLRLDGSHTGTVHPAHLAGTDAHRHAVAAEYDGVRFHELGDAPGKQQIGPLRFARRALRHYLYVGARDPLFVRALHQQAAADPLSVLTVPLIPQP